MIDETLGEQSYALDDPDVDEQAADQYAITLLNGRANATYGNGTGNMSALGLADAAMQYGKANRVDPGHVVLNFAKHNDAWALGMAAIKLLQAGEKPAGIVVNDLLGVVLGRMFSLTTPSISSTVWLQPNRISHGAEIVHR
ncbi:hypothetical protein RPN52_28755 [Pseudomonas putida]